MKLKLHICTGCGKDRAPYKRINGRVYCKYCAGKLETVVSSKTITSKETSGVCSNCQKPKVYGNKTKKLCITCNQKLKKQTAEERRKLKREKKKLTITEKKLDAITSRLVRTLYPMVCPHCKSDLEFKSANCMHFVGRNARSVRYSLRNLMAGCRLCNFYDSSHALSLSRQLDSIWGKGNSDKQIVLGQQFRNTKLTSTERKEIYDVYESALIGTELMSQSEKYELLRKTQKKYEAIINPLLK